MLTTKENENDLQVPTSSGCAGGSNKAPPQSIKMAFTNLIEHLSMSSKYPQKLQLIDALTIHQEILNTDKIPNDICLLPYLVLQKIMMYSDYRPLCKIMSKINQHFKIYPIDILLALLHCCDNILRQDLLSRLHTCKIAIPFLLPDPNNDAVSFLLWAMRSIFCEWKCIKNEEINSKGKEIKQKVKEIQSKRSRIVDYKGPIVSFLRVGSTKSPKDFSKSHMLNMVIGDHNYFFHWNCPGGSFTRKFVNGMVELSCYLPSGKDTDSFSDAAIFLNLRGDARDYAIQLDFIKSISLMSFVVLLEENLDNGTLNFMQQLVDNGMQQLEDNGMPQPAGRVVIMFPDYNYMRTLNNADRLLKIMSENGIAHIDIKDENDDEIKCQIQNLISKKVSAADPLKFLALSECATMARNNGIKVDEDDTDCKIGHDTARNMIEILDPKQSAGTKAKVLPLQASEIFDLEPSADAKAKMLPLQGSELWHKWAEHDKQSFKKRKNTVAIIDPIEQAKITIRQQQQKYVSKLTPLMNEFTKSLQTKNCSVRFYTLQWLKLFLDDRSRKILPKMRAEYENIRTELQKAKDNDGSETYETVKMLINDLKKQNKLIIEGSLGLEHLFREVGQIYEAVKGFDNQSGRHVADSYPAIMVDILNQGYPVELMDGDASHVPITWVSAVLTQLKDFHKGKRIFVTSVLGIQSTGKSTLLNTMFGLQFNVSAGRCTKGAYMQLLPVKSIPIKSNIQKSMCDYVLIVDTEGLRAPELSSTESFSHDNELATFVIGLADMAIINIYGESPGDLNDILQTAVHAFIRMKNVSVNLRCHFVHQNVTAVLADSQTKHGQEAFLTKLNTMTKYAAIAEHCESKYSSFKDVIKFNEKKDVTYFPGLWKGDPPMAPVNTGYSDKALQLKSTLMNLAGVEANKDPTFNNFQLLVKTLWNAVCYENYIFSFKNTQEVVAYNDLDAAFSEWSWTLHHKMLEWRHQAGNAISNCALSEVSKEAMTYLKKADSMLQETYTGLAQKMTNLFENSEHSYTLAQWRTNYTIRLQHLRDDCKREADSQCELLKRNRQDHLKLELIQKNHRTQLLEKVQNLVAKSKCNNSTLTQPELKREFDKKWQGWIAEFDKKEYQSMYATNDEIDIIIADVLQELLKKYDSILLPKLTKALSTKGINDLHIDFIPKNHLTKFSDANTSQPAIVVHKITAFFGLTKDNSKKQDKEVKQTQEASQNFFKEAIKAFDELKRHFHNFNRSYAIDLLKKFIDKIENYNKKHAHMLTSEYIVDMAIAFASYLAAEFIKLMNEMRIQNDPRETFERLREAYFDTFLDQYKGISSETTAARSLCRILSIAIEAAVEEILPTKIADHIKHSDPNFQYKRYFKVKVLKDLAANRNFRLFQDYLTDSKSSFESWAEKYVIEFCAPNGQGNHITLAQSVVKSKIKIIKETFKCLPKDIAIEEWLRNFHKKLNEELKIDFGEVKDNVIVATKVTNSSESFITTLSEQLTHEEEKLMKMIVDPRSKFSRITKWKTSPQSLLCEELFGCTEQCPFCGEQCELTDPNHASCGKDHSIKIHRPQCLRRFTWHDSNKLVLDLCTHSVESESRFKNGDTNDNWVPFKDYRTIYKNWCISNESPKEAPKYWQWFIYNYLDDVTKWVGAEPTSIDHLNWKMVSQDMAVQSLSEVYGVS